MGILLLDRKHIVPFHNKSEPISGHFTCGAGLDNTPTFTETQHPPNERALVDSGEGKLPFRGQRLQLSVGDHLP